MWRDRDRDVRDAGPERAHRQHQMLEAVAREDDHRAIDREAALQQRRADRLRLGDHLGIADVLPRARSSAAGDERAIGIAARPLFEPVGDALGIVGQRLGRAQPHRAVGVMLERCRDRSADADLAHGVLPHVSCLPGLNAEMAALQRHVVAQRS
jgi:hypothetical protein